MTGHKCAVPACGTQHALLVLAIAVHSICAHKACFTGSRELAPVCGALISSSYVGVRQAHRETDKNWYTLCITHRARHSQLCKDEKEFGAGDLQEGCVEAMAEERARVLVCVHVHVFSASCTLK